MVAWAAAHATQHMSFGFCLKILVGLTRNKMQARTVGVKRKTACGIGSRHLGPRVVSQAVNGLIGTLRVVRRLNPVRGPRGQPTAVPNDRSRHQPFRNSPRASSHFFLVIRFSCLQLPEFSKLPQPQKSHIMESRYDISGPFYGKILISSYPDMLMQSGAAPRDRTRTP